MKKLPSLSDYLQQEGVSIETPEAKREEVTRQYWKLYHRQYYQYRKQQFKRFTLRLTMPEYERFMHHAKRHHTPDEKLHLGNYIKAAALAYVEQKYVPRNTKPIESLTVQIQKVGNNINQVVHAIHRTMIRTDFSGALADKHAYAYLHQQYQILLKQVVDVKKEVQHYMEKPPLKLADALWELIQEQPEKIADIRLFLDRAEAEILKKKQG